MNVHQQFTVKYGELGMAAIRLVILEQLVTGCTDNLQRTVSLDTFLHGSHRSDGR